MSRAWLIVDPAAEAGGIETLPPTEGLVVLTREELADSDLRFEPDDKVAITTEAAMDEVLGRIDDDRRRAVGILKDKVAFRDVLRPMFPDLEFNSVATDQLTTLTLDPERTYVLKPALGVFGAGVRTVRGDVDLASLQDEMVAEMRRNAAVLSATALSADRLIVEQYIEGDEYAVDAFFDSSGTPVITGAYHHPMPVNPSYLHMIYRTGADVFERVESQARQFFEGLNEVLQITNLAVHSEFRLDGDTLVPIEINSMRFGGMGLGNMAYHTLGIDPYEHFIDDTTPDWSVLAHDPRSIVFFIAYNGATVDVRSHRPDWSALRARFTDIVLEVPFDHRTQLAFGVLYAREPADRVEQLLALEFDDLFIPEPR